MPVFGGHPVRYKSQPPAFAGVTLLWYDLVLIDRRALLAMTDINYLVTLCLNGKNKNDHTPSMPKMPIPLHL